MTFKCRARRPWNMWLKTTMGMGSSKLKLMSVCLYVPHVAHYVSIIIYCLVSSSYFPGRSRSGVRVGIEGLLVSLGAVSLGTVCKENE